MGEEAKPREYEMTFEDVKTIKKTSDELTGEQIFACEKVNSFNAEIGRLNTLINEQTIVRNAYMNIVKEAFEEKKEE